MIIKLAFLVFGALLMIVESALSSFSPLALAKPDLGLPFIIYGTFFLSPAEGLVAAVLFGFGREILSSGPPGALLFSSVGLLLCCIFLKSRLFIESRYTFSFVCAGSVLAECVIFLALSLFAKGETKNIYNVLVFSIPDAIVTGVVSIFMFDVFKRFKLRETGRT